MQLINVFLIGVLWFSHLCMTCMFCYIQGQTSSSHVDGEGPAWAPLCDNYMLTSSKLKDWDKKPVSYPFFLYFFGGVILVIHSA